MREVHKAGSSCSKVSRWEAGYSRTGKGQDTLVSP